MEPAVCRGRWLFMLFCVKKDETMKKIDPTVIKETKYIAAWSFILSTLMQAVFLVIGRWDHTVLLGNLIGVLSAVLNFFLMGITVQIALGKEEKEAKTTVKLSQLYRNLLLIAVAVIGIAVPCFSAWTTIIPLFFPRIAISFRPMFDKKK